MTPCHGRRRPAHRADARAQRAIDGITWRVRNVSGAPVRLVLRATSGTTDERGRLDAGRYGRPGLHHGGARRLGGSALHRADGAVSWWPPLTITASAITDGSCLVMADATTIAGRPALGRRPQRLRRREAELLEQLLGERQRRGRGGRRALRTHRRRPAASSRKSSTSRPSRSTAWARTPAGAGVRRPRKRPGGKRAASPRTGPWSVRGAAPSPVRHSLRAIRHCRATARSARSAALRVRRDVALERERRTALGPTSTPPPTCRVRWIPRNGSAGSGTRVDEPRARAPAARAPARSTRRGTA